MERCQIHLGQACFRKFPGKGMSSVTLFYTTKLGPQPPQVTVGWLVARKLIEARTSDSLIAKVFASSRLSICQIATLLKIWGHFGQFVTWSVKEQSGFWLHLTLPVELCELVCRCSKANGKFVSFTLDDWTTVIQDCFYNINAITQSIVVCRSIHTSISQYYSSPIYLQSHLCLRL